MAAEGVGVPRTQKVYTTAVRLRWPRAHTGQSRKRPVPNEEPRAAEAVLAAAKWRRVTWRQGTKRALAERFAATRVRVADGPTTRTARHLPGEEVWLIGEWRANGPALAALAYIACWPSLTERYWPRLHGTVGGGR